MADAGGATVSLEVDGQIFTGWKAVSITRTIESLAGSFTVGASELSPEDPLRREIGTGSRVTVAVGGETVVTGWVDGVEPTYSASDHGVEISGRDAAGDLVDCSAILEPGEWHDRTLGQIAADLAAPFGIEVRELVQTRPIPTFKLQEGETVFEAIERAARMRAVLPVSDGQGGLLLTRAGRAKAPTPLELGRNVLAGRGRYSDQERFSLYVLKAQQAGSDHTYGAAAAAVKGSATDPGVRRYRPLVLLGEDQADGVTAKERAQWEASVRAGRSRGVTYTVNGWRHAGGLWAPNTLAQVRDPWIAIATELLISSVRYTLDDAGGEIAELELVRPEAFALLELRDRAAKKSKGKGGASTAWGEFLDDPEDGAE